MSMNILLTYIWHIFGIYLAYLWHIFGIHLAYIWHIFSINLAMYWLTISLTYLWHIVVISLAYNNVFPLNYTMHCSAVLVAGSGIIAPVGVSRGPPGSIRLVRNLIMAR